MSSPGAAAGPADLHLHSTRSDGRLEPAAVVERAARVGIRTIALTDHDTVDGVAEARARGRALDVAVIPGVEISALQPAHGERHLLAYGVDLADETLQRTLAENRAARHARLEEMVHALTIAGVRITVEDVMAAAAGASVGRPHVADALVSAGHVGSRQEAFDRWLADGKPAAVPKRVLDCAEAIEVVHRAGGLAVLAHPGRGRLAGWDPLLDAGLDGVETIHPSHSDEDVRRLTEAARQRGLLCTGGSDNHGDPAGHAAMEACRVPGALAAALQERLAASVRPGSPA